MIIKNGLVFDENGRFVKKDLYIESGMIVSSPDEVKDMTEVDAAGLKVLPGLVDVHSHGAVGYDFSQADTEGLRAILRYEKAHGVTSYCPTSMTLPLSKLQAIFLSLPDDSSAEEARILGIHMEGPFLHPAKRGAHKESYLADPTDAFWQECQEAAKGRIKVLTMAADVPGALEFAKRHAEEVSLSLGHSMADYDTAKAAISLGMKRLTHLYNGMPGIGHREPGMIVAAAEDASCMVELISDGVHVHPAMVRSTFHMFGRDRVVLISDSLMAAGLPDGKYKLGDQDIYAKDGKIVLEDGTIAGSAMNLYDGMLQAMAFGISEEDAILAATRNPAKSIGMEHLVGVLAPGRYADVLLVDENYKIQKII